jgi:hypothetical protein
MFGFILGHLSRVANEITLCWLLTFLAPARFSTEWKAITRSRLKQSGATCTTRIKTYQNCVVAARPCDSRLFAAVIRCRQVAINRISSYNCTICRQHPGINA